VLRVLHATPLSGIYALNIFFSSVALFATRQACRSSFNMNKVVNSSDTERQPVRVMPAVLSLYDGGHMPLSVQVEGEDVAI
jgi:hypothetical protein